MEKTRSASDESAKPSASYPADEKPVLRALKRLVTQSERDEVASLPLPKAADAQVPTKRSLEGQ